jgi:hypothetical protein
MGGKSSQSTQTVSIPPQVLAQYQAVTARSNQIDQTPFQQYGGEFVSPLTSTQNAGIANTNAAAGQAQPYYGAATGYTLAGGQNVNAQQIGGQQIGQFMSPYLSDVVGSEAALLNQNNQQAMSGQLGNAIQQGAFGGDRAGIAAANLNQQQNLANAQIYSGLLNQGFNTALGAAQQQQGVNLSAEQANRQALQQTGQSLAGLGAGAQTAALQGAQAQMAAGQVQQQTQQAQDTALYNQFQQQQSLPYQQLQQQANIAEGIGANSGSTTTGSSIISDRRAKHDVHEIGKTFDGQPIYSYKYNGDDTTQIGLMAQDVEKKHPGAVGLAGGFKSVDYAKATAGAARRGHFADGGAPNHEGGVVHEGHFGEGYAGGGLIGGYGESPFVGYDPTAAYQAMYGGLLSPHGAGVTGGAGINIPSSGGSGGTLNAPKLSMETPDPLKGATQIAGLANGIGQMGNAAHLFPYGNAEQTSWHKDAPAKNARPPSVNAPGVGPAAGASNSLNGILANRISTDDGPSAAPTPAPQDVNLNGVSIDPAVSDLLQGASPSWRGGPRGYAQGGLAAGRYHRDIGGSLPYSGASGGVDVPNDQSTAKLQASQLKTPNMPDTGKEAGAAMKGIGSILDLIPGMQPIGMGLQAAGTVSSAFARGGDVGDDIGDMPVGEEDDVDVEDPRLKAIMRQLLSGKNIDYGEDEQGPDAPQGLAAGAPKIAAPAPAGLAAAVSLPAPKGSGSIADQNNNPGNIEDGKFASSMPGYAGGNGRFAKFESHEAGRAAQMALLESYIKRGYDTPIKLASRWAPAGDGNNNPAKYASFIGKGLGLGVNDKITPDKLAGLAVAQGKMEGYHRQGFAQGGPSRQAFAASGAVGDGGPVGRKGYSGEDGYSAVQGDPNTAVQDDPNTSVGLYNPDVAGAVSDDGSNPTNILPTDQTEPDQEKLLDENNTTQGKGFLGDLGQGLGQIGQKLTDKDSFIGGLGQGKANSWIPLLAGIGGALSGPYRGIVGVGRGLMAGAQAAEERQQYGQSQQKIDIEKRLADLKPTEYDIMRLNAAANYGTALTKVQQMALERFMSMYPQQSGDPQHPYRDPAGKPLTGEQWVALRDQSLKQAENTFSNAIGYARSSTGAPQLAGAPETPTAAGTAAGVVAPPGSTPTPVAQIDKPVTVSDGGNNPGPVRHANPKRQASVRATPQLAPAQIFAPDPAKSVDDNAKAGAFRLPKYAPDPIDTSGLPDGQNPAKLRADAAIIRSRSRGPEDDKAAQTKIDTADAIEHGAPVYDKNGNLFTGYIDRANSRASYQNNIALAQKSAVDEYGAATDFIHNQWPTIRPKLQDMVKASETSPMNRGSARIADVIGRIRTVFPDLTPDWAKRMQNAVDTNDKAAIANAFAQVSQSHMGKAPATALTEAMKMAGQSGVSPDTRRVIVSELIAEMRRRYEYSQDYIANHGFIEDGNAFRNHWDSRPEHAPGRYRQYGENVTRKFAGTTGAAATPPSSSTARGRVVNGVFYPN